MQETTAQQFPAAHLRPRRRMILPTCQRASSRQPRKAGKIYLRQKLLLCKASLKPRYSHTQLLHPDPLAELHTIHTEYSVRTVAIVVKADQPSYPDIADILDL